MTDFVEIAARAIRDCPSLWLHEVNENEWHVCHWGDDQAQSAHALAKEIEGELK